MGACAFALRSRSVKLNHGLELRKSLTNTAARLQEIVVEEPSSWRVFPAKGEVFEEQVEVGPHVVTFETGKLARFASGAVVVGIKDTRVLATVVGATKSEESKGFMPLQVEYREKQYAQGRIPNNFMRREGAPKERELLVSRVIDRSIRPLFPKGYYYESQVMANVLCSDGEQDPDVLAANAASAALMVSDIPWYGPVGVVRIGRVDGKLMVNPDMDELTQSDLNLVYACTVDKTIMMETQAREISNNDLKAAFYLAHAEAAKLIPPQIRLASKVENKKRSFHVVTVNKEVLGKVRSKAEVAINAVMGNPLYGKFERGKALSNIQGDVEKILKEEGDEESLKVLPLAFDQVRKEVVRRNAFEKGERVDGRKLDEVRDLQAEVNLYAPLHGSALFSRGNTQVLCTVTLGAPEDAQKLDSLVGPPKKRFMVHYSFPPYSINEVGKAMGLNRREVGHGTLAEKALLALLPPEDDFPYSVRVTSETMASDGSSSMATVCGGSLALMDAGVPLRCHVAGVSVGLITEVDESTGKIIDHRLLTDILGLEDHVGDMDFKIAGTRSGITAIQLDIKPRGIPLEILCEALEPARVAREHILERLEQEIREPSTEQKENAPRKGYFSVQRESISRLIGPQGSVVKNIERTTGVRITISDSGRVCVIAKDQASYDQAKEMVDSTLGTDIEVGKIYDVCVTSIKDFGAFVEVDGGYQGLLHVSELSQQKVYNIMDVLTLGQKLKVKCIARDSRGNIKFSLKALLSSSKPLAAVQKGDSTTMIVTDDATTAVAKTEREVLVYEFPCEKPEKSKTLWSAVKVPKEMVAPADQGQLEHSKKKGLDLHKEAPKMPLLPVENEHVEWLDHHKETSKVPLSSPESKGALRLDRHKEETKMPLSSAESTAVPKLDHHKEATKMPFSSAESKGATKLDLHKEATKMPLSSGENKSVTRRSVEMNKKFPVKVDDEYLVVVHQIKALGAVLKMMDGGLGKLFFDKETTSSSLHTGDVLHVKCSRIDSTGRPVFMSVRSSQDRE